jgi:hypothetical protein
VVPRGQEDSTHSSNSLMKIQRLRHPTLECRHQYPAEQRVLRPRAGVVLAANMLEIHAAMGWRWHWTAASRPIAGRYVWRGRQAPPVRASLLLVCRSRPRRRGHGYGTGMNENGCKRVEWVLPLVSGARGLAPLRGGTHRAQPLPPARGRA